MRSNRGRLLGGAVFAGLTVVACVLLGQHLTHTSWPLARARLHPAAGACALYFASYVLRALGWQRLFPRAERPDRATCLAACGAAAASGAVLPFRLDYVIKVATLRRLRRAKLGLEAIALSIVSLGLVDMVAFLPLSISATATSSSSFRIPLALVVFAGVCACGLLAAAPRVLRLPLVVRHERVARVARRASEQTRGSAREAVAAWFFLTGCWSTRALGSTLLLSALGVGFSPRLALVVLCISAAAALVPVASGGAVANVGATAAVLLALGVHREQAINFGLASGLLLCGTAAAAALVGAAAALLAARRARGFAATPAHVRRLA